MAKMKKAWSAVLVMVVAGVVGAAALPSAAIAEGQCNGKSKPCPLQKWMRDNVGTPMASGELATIAKSMEKAATFGGPDMKDWAKLAKKTSDDARANKTDDVKADCKACHDAYKEAYKQNAALRNKPIP
ncbi:hypothetical protein BE17_51765 [Sorangium cellulosum]|uniref:Cytochrome C n=1 Tax=Sorangium cellulosum TaxID=56 RepID=A0A150SJB9_SORCE|nr:hypothetical protein BE17_51765 [Sorangium cellulosum]